MGDVTGFDSLNVMLAERIARAQSPGIMLREIAVNQTRSFDQQFEREGFPTAWPVSKRVARHGGMTHSLSGRLRRAWSQFQIDNGTITFGPNLPYARIQFLGGTIARKSQTLLFRKTEEGQSRFLSRSAAGRRKTGAIRFARTKDYSITIKPHPLVVTDQDYKDAARIAETYL